VRAERLNGRTEGNSRDRVAFSEGKVPNRFQTGIGREKDVSQLGAVKEAFEW
jgi:hypothetical protein